MASRAMLTSWGRDGHTAVPWLLRRQVHGNVTALTPGGGNPQRAVCRPHPILDGQQPEAARLIRKQVVLQIETGALVRYLDPEHPAVLVDRDLRCRHLRMLDYIVNQLTNDVESGSA